MVMIQKRTINPRIIAYLLLFLLILTKQSFASFSASVDRTTIAIHETFELSLRTDSDSSNTPDFKALEKNFDILGTRQSRQVRIINGRSESWREWTVTLSPKRKGNLAIPELALGNERSTPINIAVRDSSTGSQDNVASISPVFMRAELDNEQIYIQQQAVLTLKIFHRVNLYDDSRLSPLEIEDAIVQQLGETKKYESVIEGTRYGIFELKFAIYPQKAGSLTIPTMTFTGTMADRRDPFGGVFSMGGKPIVARSPEILLSVQEQPTDYPGPTWLPAKKLTLKESWSQPVDSIKVGDAITRTITMEAEGLNAAQLPPLNLPSPSGVNSYPDQSSAEDIPTPNGVIGKRISAIAMVPTEAGNIELPPINVTWFDTQQKVIKQASIPGQIIKVLPAENYELIQPFKAVTVPDKTEEPVTTVEEVNVESTRSSNYWKWIAAALAGLWLITGVILWIFLRKSRQYTQSTPVGSIKPEQRATSKTSNEAAAYQELEKACLNTDKPEIILENLKNWCRVFLNEPELKTIQECVDRLGSEELKSLCAKIDAELYSNQPSQISGEELLNECRKAKQLYKKETTEELTELYPG